MIAMFSSWWFILLVFNAIIGICMLEGAWKNTIRFRCPPSQELEDLFPAFRRTDALKWPKWKLYPGAMLLLVPRMLSIVITLLLLTFFLKITLVCHDLDKPLRGCRKTVINFFYKVAARSLGVFGFFTWHTYVILTEEEVDYSLYLGTNQATPIPSSIGGQMRRLYS